MCSIVPKRHDFNGRTFLYNYIANLCVIVNNSIKEINVVLDCRRLNKVVSTFKRMAFLNLSD